MFARPVTHSEALGPGCAGPDLALAQAPPVGHWGGGPRVHAPTSGAAPCAVEPGAVAPAAGPHQHTQ
jgi:20S proteasome subunit beta 7